MAEKKGISIEEELVASRFDVIRVLTRELHLVQYSVDDLQYKMNELKEKIEKREEAILKLAKLLKTLDDLNLSKESVKKYCEALDEAYKYNSVFSTRFVPDSHRITAALENEKDYVHEVNKTNEMITWNLKREWAEKSNSK